MQLSFDANLKLDVQTVRTLFTAAVVLLLSACANRPPDGLGPPCVTCPTSGTSAPTVPPATAKIVSVTILPDIREMKVGDSVVFWAQVQMSAGVPPPGGPPPLWETDNPAVATVAQGGRLTALAPGEVTLTVRVREATATRPLKIVP
jgi:hypothetical protein